ncbi:MAG: hypothetical protein HDR01_12835 [Lachnospiraceae bacterium]|nr:hypothetical protein [Lachnospiraceae bacterium]
MEKKNRLLYVFISILVSFFGYLIYYTVYQISIVVLGTFLTTINNGLMAEITLKWCILIVEGLCMLILIYHFHRETKGLTIGYVEVCLLLWLCAILEFGISSKQKTEMSTVLILDIFLGIIKDIKLVTGFLIVFALASVCYKAKCPIVRKVENKTKCLRSNKKQKLICIFSAIPASLSAYVIYRLVNVVLLEIIVQLFIAPNLWEMDNICFDILMEILGGFCFAILLQNFHQKTKGMLIGYMEAVFLLWIPVLWIGLNGNSKWINTFHNAASEKWLLPVFLFILIAVSLYYKKNKSPRKTKTGLLLLGIMFSYGIYYVLILCISIANFSNFELALIISSIIFSIFFFVIQQLSKGKIIKQLLMAYAVFLSGLLLLCGIYIAQEWNIGSPVLNQKDYLEELIKDMVPNLEMYFAYGFSIAAGGILAQGWQWLHGEASSKEK